MRSAGGVEAVLLRKREEREAADPRILGAGAFVEEVWAKSEPPKRRTFSDLDGMLTEVSESTGVSREEILGPSQTHRAAGARRLFYLRAQEETGATAALLGRLTGRSHVAVTKAVHRARRLGEGKTEQA